jgi:hypothetical protein
MKDLPKAAQRSTLIMQFGRVMAPIYALADQATPPTAAEYRVAVAALTPDLGRWNEEVNTFATVGGYRFGQEANDIMRPAHNFNLGQLTEMARNSRTPAENQVALRQLLQSIQIETLEAIDRVPIEWEPRLLEARTPFTVHMHVGDAINTAKRRIHYFDRYVTSDFFPLYLREIPRTLQVRLVATLGNANFGVTNDRSISALAAGEFSDYQLIECHHTDLHDRNLRIDNRLFFLGPSMNAAGTHPTNFAPTDSSPAAHTVLDAIIAKGTSIT